MAHTDDKLQRGSPTLATIRDALIAMLRLTEEAQAVGAMMVGWTELSADEVDPRIVRAGAIYFERTGKQLCSDLGTLIDTVDYALVTQQGVLSAQPANRTSSETASVRIGPPRAQCVRRPDVVVADFIQQRRTSALTEWSGSHRSRRREPNR
jgi:hypothetical protein